MSCRIPTFTRLERAGSRLRGCIDVVIDLSTVVNVLDVDSTGKSDIRIRDFVLGRLPCSR